ncbi:hypothetical protein Q3G72_031419 [Acer saccharum]|nr:hypothetical protein Q3G72_031419 [Acer saccharum]
MADNPKLDSTSSCEASGFEDHKNNKVSILDHVNGFQYNAIKKSDSFVIDMDTFSGPINKDHINANSRITLQRSLSRKGSQRGGAAAASAAAAAAAEKKINSIINDRDTIVSTSSPRGHGTTSEKQTMAAAAAVGADHSGGERGQGHHHHHQITITTGNMISGSASPDNRSAMKKRNYFKRSSSTWVIDPKRVLLFFATLSSMGTILLIYFTIAVGKYHASDESRSMRTPSFLCVLRILCSGRGMPKPNDIIPTVEWSTVISLKVQVGRGNFELKQFSVQEMASDFSMNIMKKQQEKPRT